MTTLTWDEPGEHYFETGVDRGVLYPYVGSAYEAGIPWNGLTGVTESPSGAEATGLYADNLKYLNLVGLEMFGGTIEAYTYPDEFALCDGTTAPAPGVSIGQQPRKMFGFCYRTNVGNDVEGSALGYKLHLVYGALAAPSEKAYATINDTPEAITFSWTFSTTPVAVTGHNNTSVLVVDSTKVDAGALAALEDLLYGTVGTDAELPLPDVVIDLFDGVAATSVTPTQPTFVAATGAITIPTITGVQYFRADTGATVTGVVTIGVAGTSLMIRARPLNSLYVFPTTAANEWSFTRDP